ncbi:WGxxGxxG family protein [Staphylospora marina]|uniref:WGxxGxxG family protein n=1 Tax=Staphylospora marina TaxID=2490858 RepID=UPI000F5BDC9E|nr:WGxxGxxG family protein [Staphylospora marina]
MKKWIVMLLTAIMITSLAVDLPDVSAATVTVQPDDNSQSNGRVTNHHMNQLDYDMNRMTNNLRRTAVNADLDRDPDFGWLGLFGLLGLLGLRRRVQT